MKSGRVRQACIRWLLGHPTGRWVILGGSVGILCGLAAVLFDLSTDVVSRILLEQTVGLPPLVAADNPANLDPINAFSPLLLLVVLLCGGLVAGFITTFWSSSARGGGTGVAVHAFHHERGHIPLSTAWAKLAASIVSLGSGGSGGREGPISLVGAGFASWFAGRLRISARDRRILLAAGIAGGISAMFHAPLAASIFAAEVLYRGPELEADVVIPGFIAAIVAYLVDNIGLDLLGPLVGAPQLIGSTLFHPPFVAFRVADWMQLAGYSLVALASALAAYWFMIVHRYATRTFDHIALPIWTKPALGALATGLIAISLYCLVLWTLQTHDQANIMLSTVGGGYGVLRWLFLGAGTEQHWLVLPLILALIAFGKALTTALTTGSGGSAGLFGPSIVIGGCAGGAVGYTLIGLSVAPPPAACVLMGMAGVLAATHRTPIAALLMVSEIGGNWLLLLPAMWVCGLSFLLTSRRSLIRGQVYGVHDSPAHRSRLFADVLAQSKVSDLLGTERKWTVIPAQSSVDQCRLLIQGVHQDHFPVIQENGKLVGMVDRLEIVHLGQDAVLDLMVIADDLAGGAGVVLHPEESLASALKQLHNQHVEELPVTDGRGQFIGLITSGMLMEHYHRQVERADSDRKEEGFFPTLIADSSI